MHRSHEYLAKIAIETMDGVLISLPARRVEAGRHPRRRAFRSHQHPG